MMTRLLALIAALVLTGLGVLYVLGGGAFGQHRGPGETTGAPRPATLVRTRTQAQDTAARQVGVSEPKQILFGDLHVHSTYSTDAFLMSLSVTGGDGAYPVTDACDFARYCSALDFWSINDHALALTPESWQETVTSIRQCNDVAGDAQNPDLVSYLGWEWTQMGTRPGNHYGHKNVIFRGLGDDEIPTRPISASPPPEASARTQPPSRFSLGLLPLLNPSQETLDLVRYFNEMSSVPACPDGVPERELPATCRESAAEPAQLFAKLDDWGLRSMVIPHGTTWGFYTPQGSSWDKQLVGSQHDPARQTLIEIFSGHGNSEEFRTWKEVEIAADGSRSCPEPRDDYLPSCWQAGEIIRARCSQTGESEAECDSRAVAARQNYVDGDIMGHLTVPGAAPEDWLDSGQCRTCFQPAFNYRPKSSVQYIMALRDFADPQAPRRFDFGFMASSDNHSARPGTGYKEVARTVTTEARFGEFVKLPGSRRQVVAPAPRSEPFERGNARGSFFAAREAERQASFFLTGGLVAVHSSGRSREAIWEGLERKEVYGTSGPRILLWFDLMNPADGGAAPLPMGSSASVAEAPVFQVRAVGSFEQKPGCPPETSALGPGRIERLCRDECYNPSDQRRRITRIEVVRIRPQIRSGEPIEPLVSDPWLTLLCGEDPAGCSVSFSDPEFAESSRDALYYVRAIEEPSLAVNADALRCERDERGRCLAVRACTDPSPGDDCLAPTEERAWSSPIFVSQAR